MRPIIMTTPIVEIKSKVMVLIYDYYVVKGIKSAQEILTLIHEREHAYKTSLFLFSINRTIHMINKCGYNPYKEIEQNEPIIEQP